MSIAVLGVTVPGGPDAASAATPSSPNIVLILTDDQRWDTLWAMPIVTEQLVDPGILFRNGYVVNPVCCASRATILTGEYSHTTGVYTNHAHDAHGGFRAFHDGSTIATWLHDAGYRTAFFGKYLNGYHTDYVPPGWDRWFATYRHGGYYDYTATDDGLIETFGEDPSDYGTTVLDQEAVGFIHDTDPEQPLFLDFDTHAPHAPATPAPGDEDAFSTLEPWRPPSYDEAHVSDKPAYVRSLPRLTPDVSASIDAFRIDQYRTLLSVDRAVGDIIQALRDTGRLQNTLIVFLSDNGLMWGEHRLHGKNVPYEEAVRVPFVVRYDAAILTPGTDQHLALNLDLAPTFADAAGIDAPGAEGTSLLPLLTSGATGWRRDFLIEHLSVSASDAPTFCEVHSKRFELTEYGTGEAELYDLRTDPSELRNVAGKPAYARQQAHLLHRLRLLCSPPPPGYRVP